MDYILLVALVAVALVVSLSAIATAGRSFGWWDVQHYDVKANCTQDDDNPLTEPVPCKSKVTVSR
jgi:hypothetical protein